MTNPKPDLVDFFASNKRLLMPGRKLLKPHEYAVKPYYGDGKFRDFLAREGKTVMTISHYTRWYRQWASQYAGGKGLSSGQWILVQGFSKRVEKAAQEAMMAALRWRQHTPGLRLDADAFSRAREQASQASEGYVRVLGWSLLSGADLMRLEASQVKRVSSNLGVVLCEASTMKPERWVPVFGPGAEALRDGETEGLVFPGLKWWIPAKNFRRTTGETLSNYSKAFLRDAWNRGGLEELELVTGHPYTRMERGTL